MEDSKLLRLLHKDPSAGMEQLMNQYAGLVYAVVKGKYTGSCYVSTDFEDCVADVFSEFYTELAKYDPKISSIKSYLCVLARYHAIDVARKRVRQRGDFSLDDEDSLLQIADNFTIEGDIAEDEIRHEVLSAVKELGEPDSSIIIRKYYFGESSKDIADALKLTVSNVDTRTHRALNKLRKLFGGKEV
ncbi:MAG: sigma-70 family RNA polymerase sigma factor [Clostridiales bacterium]|nr:sigma-70 family RNA polymerase sigma factor [Clostridiales bacterium]